MRIDRRVVTSEEDSHETHTGRFDSKISHISKSYTTVWTSNVTPAEIVRRPSGDHPETLRGGLQIFWLNNTVKVVSTSQGKIIQNR